MQNLPIPVWTDAIISSYFLSITGLYYKPMWFSWDLVTLYQNRRKWSQFPFSSRYFFL